MRSKIETSREPHRNRQPGHFWYEQQLPAMLSSLISGHEPNLKNGMPRSKNNANSTMLSGNIGMPRSKKNVNSVMLSGNLGKALSTTIRKINSRGSSRLLPQQGECQVG